MAEPQRGQEHDPVHARAHFLIVEARFYDRIGAMLLAGAQAALGAAGATFDVVRVPGSLELPLAMAFSADGAEREGRPYGGAVALGCILRGETYHFEVVANESARALIDVALARALPLGNAILTVEDEAQALVRADPAKGDKGGEAVRAMLALWRIKQPRGAVR